MPSAVITHSATQPQDKQETAPPSFDDILDELRASGLNSEQAGAILDLFSQLKKLVIHYDQTGVPLMVFVDEEDTANAWEAPDMPYIAAVCLPSSDSRHEALDLVMPDLATSTLGSAHDLLERGLLSPRDTFVHDRIGHCVIAVKRG
ncbi:MAG TPA: hypothetical protein VMR75_01605 [Candidatus Saccharimonadales bacterium]|nr:hypothetical protein [Candidatus Saccharimonadales bacterium]